MRELLEAELVWKKKDGGREAGRVVVNVQREESEGEREGIKVEWKQPSWQDCSERFGHNFEFIFLSQRSPASPRTWSASVPASLSHQWGATYGRRDLGTGAVLDFRTQRLGSFFPFSLKMCTRCL